jgi:Glycosyltransferase family 87
MWKRLVLVVTVLSVLGYVVQRDIRFEKGYTGDLRNRVTGARMIKDGRSPYFYKWKKGEGLRYYDPENFDSVGPSNMTSTPVLYRILSPLVELPQATISVCWLAAEYLILACLALFALSQAGSGLQKQLVLLVCLLALLTNGWKEQVANGQTYLLVPLFAMLFLVFWQKSNHAAWAIAAGASAACLVLIRVNTLLFFVPFLFMTRRHTRSWLIVFFIPIGLFAVWTLSTARERGFWRDYFLNVTEATKLNQADAYVRQVNEPDPRFPRWEGVDTMESYRNMQAPPAKIYSENGNVFVFYRFFFHRKVPVAILALLSLLLVASLTVVFYRKHRAPDTPQLATAVVFGFCLFMIPDLFSPIYRHQYYTVQWFLPLMIAAANFSSRFGKAYAFLLLGFLLNCLHLPFIKMENSIGEYLIALILLSLALSSTWPEKPNPLQARVSGDQRPDSSRQPNLPE